MNRLVLILVCLLACIGAHAQHPDTTARPDTNKKTVQIRICVPRRGSLPPPLYVFNSGKKRFITVDSISLDMINPKWLEDVKVYKQKKATELFGEKAKHGVMEITFKDQPEAKKLVKELLKQNKIKEVN